jgi:hypothetical protein
LRETWTGVQRIYLFSPSPCKETGWVTCNKSFIGVEVPSP